MHEKTFFHHLAYKIRPKKHFQLQMLKTKYTFEIILNIIIWVDEYAFGVYNPIKEV